MAIPGRFAVTVVYWNEYSHTGTVPGRSKVNYCGVQGYSDEGYSHPGTVPGRSTVTVVYGDTLTKG